MIPLHRIRFEWKTGVSIELEYNEGVEGEKYLNHLPENLTDAYQENSELGQKINPISIINESSFFFPVCLKENVEYICSIKVPLAFDNLKEQYHSLTKTYPFINQRLAGTYKRDPVRLWISEQHEGNSFTTITGRIKFSNRIGVADLSLGSKEQLLVEVSSNKISYFDDFTQLVNDISEHSVNLLLNVGNATNLRFSTDYSSSFNHLSALFHLRNMFKEDNLPQAIEAILNTPYSRLIQEDVIQPISRVRKPDQRKISTRSSQLAFASGGGLAAIFNGYTPTKLFERKKYEVVDTPENRYVKNFLFNIQELCYKLQKALRIRIETSARTDRVVWETSLYEVENWLSKVNEWLQENLWNEIGRMSFIPTNSQVLQKREGYRHVFQMDHHLQMGMNIEWNPIFAANHLHGDIRPIYELYEFWCFFNLIKILKGIFNEINEDDTTLWEQEPDRLKINLIKGLESKITFSGSLEGINLSAELFYNRAFREESYSLNFTPDFSIRIFDISNGKPEAYLHFDAKYKLDNINEFTTSKKEDIVKMHAYQDAIKNTICSYILYPGMDIKSYKSIPGKLNNSIGALPMRIGSTTADSERIKTFIINIIKEYNEPS